MRAPWTWSWKPITEHLSLYLGRSNSKESATTVVRQKIVDMTVYLILTVPSTKGTKIYGPKAENQTTRSHPVITQIEAMISM